MAAIGIQEAIKPLYRSQIAERKGPTRQKPSLLTAWRDAWDNALRPVTRASGFVDMYRYERAVALLGVIGGSFGATLV